jgi:hypothetical protein
METDIMGNLQDPDSPSSHLKEMASIYDNLWENSRGDLIRGLVELDPVPDTNNTRWGVSAVARIKGRTAEVLETVALQLAEFTGKRQVVYSSADLHTTLYSIEPYRLNVADDDDRVHKYLELLKTIAQEYPPVRIAYKGLTANKTGVMAQGWPVDTDFLTIRSLFHDKLRECNLLNGFEGRNVRQTAHASLIVYSQPLQFPTSLVEFIENNRQTEYGTALIRSIEVVRYQRTAFDVKLITLGQVFFGK